MRQVRTVCVIATVLSCAGDIVAAPREVHWETAPYRIAAELRIDAPGQMAESLAATLPIELDERVAATIGPLWQWSLTASDGRAPHNTVAPIRKVEGAAVDGDDDTEIDKRLLLAIEATPWGYRLSAREYDYYTQRWSRTLHASTRQRDALPEQLFALVRQAVAPLAKLEPHPEDPKQVLMTLRGSALPAKSLDIGSAAPGDLFLPLIRHTNRDGVLVEDGIQSVPWTYLEVIPSPSAKDKINHDGAAPLVAKIHSGLAAPLSRRRRARTEQVAIAIRPDGPGQSTVRLLSRADGESPLVGYDVEIHDAGAETARVVEQSDERGEVRVESGESRIQTLIVKSGGSTLARVPIVPGLEKNIDVRLPDETVRLRAAARLASLREDLVDLVARRSIYMARVRQKIEEKDYDRAWQLMGELDQLPSATQFNRSLDREAQLHRSNDPQVQRRIKEMFTATQLALGKFLDPRPIGELHDELRQAEGGGS